MKKRTFLFRTILAAAIMLALAGCSKDRYLPDANGLLKKILVDGYIIEEISYNQDNLVSEVHSIYFYRRFHYNQSHKLVKEEVAVSPDLFSSSVIPGSKHEFVDPDRTGISMYHIYEYDDNGRLSVQLNNIPKTGNDELRSKRGFEYNDKDLISKILLYNSDNEVTQFRTYLYDSNNNVIEEDYWTYLFTTSGEAPEHVAKITFEYDSFHNPYKIFEQGGNPGIHTNTNNIIKTITVHYDPSPGIPAYSETTTSYEYNPETGFPVRVIDGEEYIYK
jgi:hypothetical protein